jgi:hypothetical protein
MCCSLCLVIPFGEFVFFCNSKKSVGAICIQFSFRKYRNCTGF